MLPQGGRGGKAGGGSRQRRTTAMDAEGAVQRAAARQHLQAEMKLVWRGLLMANNGNLAVRVLRLGFRVYG